MTNKIESYYKQDALQKASLAYNWERNHLFLDGQQWLIYEGNRDTGGMWVKFKPSPANEYIPRPVTNYIYDGYQTLKGYILKNKPRSSVSPNSQSSKDKTAAKIAELVSESNWERLKEQDNYEYAASGLITYGTVFKKDYWDSSYLSLARVPRMEQRPAIDQASGMPTGQMEEVQSVDEQGNPVFDEMPLGDVQTAVVEPYCITLDPMATTISNIRWIMEYSIRPLTWIRENYDRPVQNQAPMPEMTEGMDDQELPQEQEPGYTGRASEVLPEKALSNAMRRFYQLKTSSGIRGTLGSSQSTLSSGSEGQMIEEAAVVKEYYERPTKENPNGRLIVVANGVPLYVDRSPYEGPEQGDWHPYSECRWELVPGRFWGKGPLDDGCEIQKQINSIDSIIQLTRKTMAVPQKLEPRGSIAKNDSWTGRPGQRVSYTPGPNGEKPETIAPVGVHESVFAERAQKVEDLKSIMGAPDILKGDRPPGVTAYSALSLLFEVGTGKLFPVMDRWKKFIESSQKKQLRLIAQKYREPRPEFIKILLTKNSELTEDQIRSFIGTDLYDNCNVVIEASSSIPQLKAAEHAKLQELANMGVLNLENPQNRNEFLDRFGIQGFDSDYSKDAKRAAWENDLIDNMLNDPNKSPILLQTDNHPIHVSIHADRTKEPSFMALPFELQKAYFDHIQEHEMQIEAAEQQQQMKAMAMGQPPQPQQPNPMDAKENIRKGQPVPKSIQQAANPEMSGPLGAMAK